MPRTGHLLDAGVEAHRIGSSWRMANVKQLDLFRGIGPSTGGELVDYSAGPVANGLDAHAGRRVAAVSVAARIGNWASSRACGSTGIRSRARRRGSRGCASRGASATTTVWGGVAVQAQTPSHESLQSFDYFHLTQADGARLRNERSRQIVAGVEQAFARRFALRVEAYRRRFDRLLVHRLETDAERATRLASYIIPPDLPAEQRHPRASSDDGGGECGAWGGGGHRDAAAARQAGA